MTAQLPGRRQIVETLSRFRQRRPRLAAALLAFDASVYCVLWILLMLAPVWMKIPLAAAAALAIARLFVLGHDACHGSYFDSAWANAVLGRMAFLPSLTPFSTWELGHNTLHHGFTNLRGKDYGYTPFSKTEFDALPAWRRGLERAYRHPLGPGLFYAADIWWRRLWFPRGADARPVHQLDSALVAAFALAQIAAAWRIAGWTGQNPWAVTGWGLAAPFAVWKCLMGFVTVMHHTSPATVWYAHRRDWDPAAAQLENSVHIVFPAWFSAALGNIMDHTAHHLDSRIPLFALPAAQLAVEEMFPERVIAQPWSLGYYLDCCRRCKLYDYDRRRWLGFDGEPS